jgi:hypothetical protein
MNLGGDTAGRVQRGKPRLGRSLALPVASPYLKDSTPPLSNDNERGGADIPAPSPSGEPKPSSGAIEKAGRSLYRIRIVNGGSRELSGPLIEDQQNELYSGG